MEWVNFGVYIFLDFVDYKIKKPAVFERNVLHGRIILFREFS